ncbi:MAG: amino acid adenylation domain-containing protein [Cyanobacteria bacterium P01_G01_bin.19]
MNNVTDIYELSPMQQGMLFHTIYAPNSGVYFEQRSCLLTGKLNTVNFRQAWQQIINRYPILRTGFYWEDLEKPLQVVFNDAELPWVEEDWSDLTQQEQQIKLTDWLKSDRNRGFILSQAPLMRCALIQLAKNKYRFVWSHHHILMDGWCNGILLQEVLAIYKSLCHGESLYLEAPQAYKNYIVWLQEQEIEKAQEYWQYALLGFEQQTSLSNHNSDSNNNLTKEVTINLSLEITKKLVAFSTKYRLTLNTIIQGAWAILLNRYCDRSDVLFGATVSGRPANLPGVESIVGLFINTLPVRVQLPPELELIPWLQQIQQQQTIREEYSYSSLVDIQQWSNANKERPLFDSLVIFENYPISLEEFLQNSKTDFTISDLKGFEKTNYPLTIYAIPGEKLKFKISYDIEYFTKGEIEDICDRLTLILNSFIESPQQKLANISIIKPSELEQFNGDRLEYPQDLLLPQLFEAKVSGAEEVEEVEDKFALVSDNGSFSYVKLNERVNQLAHHLQSLGVGKNNLVGIYLNRNSNLIISLLAILKAGAAYVPLDPTYPQERISYIINHARISHLITEQDIDTETLNIEPNLSVINLITEQEKIDCQSKENLNLKISHQDLAYIIYTSGSTGKPKGVAIQHSSLLNFLHSMKEQPEIIESDKLLAITTISFDIAALEIYLPLITGATVVLANKETTIDADRMSQTIAENNITIMQATPATWQMLIDNNWQGKPDLKILSGGEALSRSLALELDSRCQEIWNLYGPTETTIWSSIYKFNSDKHPELNTIPIGKPIANTQLYILDSQLNIMPPGRSGELYIGGDGLARGYLHHGNLTAEKFISNPFVETYHSTSLQDTRLYKTGDRVRQLPNDDIEYIGRIDNQIKLRGYRIELGEIETVLTQNSLVKNAVVIPSQDNLIAYVTLSGGAEEQRSNGAGDLRQYLAKRLPSYMIPGHIISLESFPLTPNGKIDRRALSEIKSDRLEMQPISSTTVQTPTEEVLINIWTEILQRKQITTKDNFFEIGGHSLLATRVVSQIRQIFSIELPLRTLFEHPTVEDLAQAVDRLRKSSINKPVNIAIIDREGELPLSFAQQRQWFLHQLEPDNPWYNISTAVKITGNLNCDRLQQCFDTLVARQEILRTSFLTVGGKPQIVINNESEIKISEIDLSNLSASEKQLQIKQLQAEEANQPFDLERSPLMRVKLLQTAPNEQILLLNLHHIIGDGWSMGVLVEEIVGLYWEQGSGGAGEAGEAGKVVGANGIRPSNNIQYVDYAAWQRKYLQGEVLARQVEYWQEKLQDAPAISSIAPDFPRKPQTSFESAAYNFQINQRITQSLKQIARSNSGTLFITLYAALALLIHRYTDNDDLVIGTPIANRDRAEVEGLIGFFANTLALRINLADNPSFTELVTRARETALEAYSHQDLPFEQLIDRLQLERSLSHTPLFQVMLVLEEQRQKTLELEGITWQPLERVTTQAKFELTFFIKETERGLQGSIEYNQALFTADTIHRLAGHFRTLLTSITKNPEANISNISLLSKSELKQITNKFNQSNNVTIDSCIHQLFERQAQKTPDATAVIDREATITYQELNYRADTLADYLQSLGVSLETKVGIMSDRNIDTIVALLAILKAGGCYIPLDPNYPQERLDYIIQDTRLNILLTQTEYAGNFDDKNITVIEGRGQKAEGRSKKSFAPYPLPLTQNKPVTNPNNLAYITYTSGSTGTPKGVAIPHRGVIRLVKEPNYVKLNTDTRLLQAASISFDASTFEIWGALLNGGTLVILSNSVPSLEELGETIVKHQIDTLWLTAGLFRLMVDEQLESFRNVRQLLAGGDVLSPRHIKKLLQAHPQCSVINGYGPTETTTFACCCSMDRDTEIDSNCSIIGYPISNTQLYILDKYLNPLPIGVPGELYIAGEGLARGYLDQEDLTAEKFIPNAFESKRQKPLTLYPLPFTLYRTGDRVRHTTDGRIEYLGRIDNQVKIRGFRVELGEIEATLNGLDGVKDSVVLVKESDRDNKQLVAYIILNDLISEKEYDWRKLLKSKLPDYLIPSFFIPCESFPITTNGKIDSKVLLELEIIAPDRAEDTQQPKTDLEQKLVAIWSKVLNLETVSTNSNFFSLGGDSILAIQIVAEANQVGIKITPRQLFENQTIAELATVATTEIINTAEQGLVMGEIPLTPIQRWFFELDLVNPNHFNQSVLLEIKQDLDLNKLQSTLEQLLIHHDALRIKFTTNENSWKQYNLEEIKLNIEQVDLSNLSESEQSQAITDSCDRFQSSLDITNNLIEVAYFNLGSNNNNRLLIIIHHLLIDGVSWRILLADLQAAYQQLDRDEIIQLPAKTTSYKQWSEYLQDYANESLSTSLDYWLSQNKYNDYSLPKDNDNENTLESRQSIKVVLDRESTQALLQDVNQTYNTQIDDLLLTALIITFAEYTNKNYLLIDLESQGRTQIENDLDISRTVGWFTNIYSVLLEINNPEDIGKNIKTIKERLRQVQKHSFNYGIIKYLQNNQQIKQLPAAPISFNYLGQFDNLDTTSSLFQLAPESTGNNWSIENQTSHAIAINCSIINSELQIIWDYNCDLFKGKTVANFANNYLINLQKIITHCQTNTGDYTPSDFSLTDLKQSTINSISKLVEFD